MNSVRVYIERRFASQDFDVYFIARDYIYRWRDGTWHADKHEEGQRLVEPSLRLPRDVLEELVRAAEGHVHAEDATVAHLKDAAHTRDRLLALIEKRGLR